VDLETYIYAADEVGWRIGEALAARARAGVRVRVLVDAAGSLFSFSDSLESYLRQHGHRGRLARPETRSFATIPASAGTRCIASTSGFSAVPGGAFL
jgi:phosphatidylserine/phosphatidylglycerophosphate/cardiolipin synthase-like enzyme